MCKKTRTMIVLFRSSKAHRNGMNRASTIDELSINTHTQMHFALYESIWISIALLFENWKIVPLDCIVCLFFALLLEKKCTARVCVFLWKIWAYENKTKSVEANCSKQNSQMFLNWRDIHKENALETAAREKNTRCIHSSVVRFHLVVMF